MIVAHYLHRLPANYDIGLIRERAAARGSLWNDTPRLFFKAFLLREKGRYGAIASSYSSLYLWQDADAFAAFLMDGRYRVVTDSFGRADIETRFVLEARKGPGQEARFALLEEAEIPVDADLTAAFASEIDRNRSRAGAADVVAAVIGVDPRRWRVIRIVLSEAAPIEGTPGVAYQILHLARPLLHLLPGDSC
ncbi:protein of unknown function [Enhydrobacter aerosaccus]|uniref:DUF4865 domain-containing protein n=1 Tax=Enhydrobacter aerosaccus TaxID=225324 RepID=A0A1T4N8E5_9HYPH|nr:DUF4865 family protein [Enhydrobacter aerosaccus]SJZ75504.1 protein of unknown function [Enhydrobacter aerosaccus]